MSEGTIIKDNTVLAHSEMRVDAEKNLLLVKGAVPGAKKALITVKESVKVAK